MPNASGPVPPPAPPPPTSVPSWRDKKQTKDYVVERESLSKPLTITIDGEEVPRALQSAFNNPRKDKKPFSYFTGGQAPDLTNKPSPKSIRKSNPPIYIQGAPKVLPIVSDQELKYEEKRQTNLHPHISSNNGDMSSSTTLMHAQYNSPLALYSKDNVQEELNRATGGAQLRPSSGLGAPSKFNLEHQSGAYRMVHGENRVPTQHSARLEEQHTEDYPRYRGFVDPNVQSPSFKRLQHLAGLESGTDEEVHAASRGANVGGRQSATGAPKEEPIPLGYSSTTTTSQNQTTAAYQNGPHVAEGRVYSPVPPQWSAEGPPVAQHDPAVGGQLDPNFAAKIAAAERPNVPPSVSPSWARKAEQKHEKWQEYSNQQQQQTYQQQQQYRSPSPISIPIRQEYQPPRHYQPPQPQPGWSQPSTQGYQDKWQRHYSQYNFEQGRTGQEHNQPVTARPRSTDPDSWRRKDYWLKPYVAPNVEARLSPSRGSNPGHGGRPFTDIDTTTPSWAQPQNFGGQSFASPGGGTGSYTKKTTTTSYRSHTTSGGRSPQPPQDYGTNYAPRKEVNVSTLVSGQAERPSYVPPQPPDWSYKAEEKKQLWENYGSNIDPTAQRRPPLPDRPPAWTQRADDTTRLWRNEAEAWRQRSQMEQDISRRAASAGPEQPQGPGGAFWRQRPISHQPEGTVTTYTTTGPPPAMQKWQDASGASTKSQSQGSYVDPQGNQVNYVKEVYTSSDPGKEFSMLTQEEKKTLEEPLEPGVVSRHVTSKYYKKSTYTSQTTTSTNQAPPAVSYPPMHQRSIDAPPRPGSYGPGDTQF